MATATSTSESSLSSVLANALLSTVGVSSSVSKNYVKPTVRQRVAKAFTDRIRREAGTEELWGSASESLSVTIDDQDRVKVSATGGPEEQYTAEMLEYGTPSSPPRAVMRTYESSFNEEYKVMLNVGGL